MKSVAFRTFVLVLASVTLLGRGGKSESERAYADTCVKIWKSSSDAQRKRCECEASIVVPKLTPGELKVYLASMDWPSGKAMNQAEVSKFAADHGFTMEEYSSYGGKSKMVIPEVEKTCFEKK